jgi:type IV secretion system protein VirD4
MLTVGGGRGIRFNLFLQDFAQLDTKYDKDEAKTIRSNCETWVYLKSNDTETNKAISERLGKYTTTVYSLSNSTSRYSAPSSGSSVQLTGRELLLADEVARIKRPEALVITAGNYPVVTQLPDISRWMCNDMLGLGSPKHNSAVIAARAMGRPERDACKPQLWGIWDEYAGKSSNLFDALQSELAQNQPSAFADFNALYDEADDGYYTQGADESPGDI